MISSSKLYHILLISGIHAIAFIIFLSISYFTVIINMKEDILVNFIVRGAKFYGLDKIPIENIPKFNTLMNTLKKQAETEESEYKENNNKLKIKTAKIIGYITIGYMVFMYLFPVLFNVKYTELNYKRIALETVLLIMIVGLYEFLFLKYVVLEYSFFNFNKFLYEYVKTNIISIRNYLPSILLHFMVDIPSYKTMIPGYLTRTITNNAKKYI